MKKQKNFLVYQGQALITLLFFSVIALTVTSAAVVMVLVSAQSGSAVQDGEVSYQVAKSGAENGLLRLIRNPNYTGETLTIGTGTATISVVVSGGVYTITSLGQVGNYIRKVQITATYSNNLLTVTSEKEIF